MEVVKIIFDFVYFFVFDDVFLLLLFFVIQFIKVNFESLKNCFLKVKFYEFCGLFF